MTRNTRRTWIDDDELSILSDVSKPIGGGRLSGPRILQQRVCLRQEECPFPRAKLSSPSCRAHRCPRCSIALVTLV